MLKKTVTYTDFNDEQVTEDLYFNFTKLELAEKDLELDLERTIERITKATDAKEAYPLFKHLLLSAYGERSDDGRKFYKEDERGVSLSRNLASSPALEVIIFEFLENPEAGAQFIEACLPAKLVQEVKEAEAKGLIPQRNVVDGASSTATVELPAGEPVLEAPANTEPTDEELLKMNPRDMTEAQLRRAFALKNQSA